MLIVRQSKDDKGERLSTPLSSLYLSPRFTLPSVLTHRTRKSTHRAMLAKAALPSFFFTRELFLVCPACICHCWLRNPRLNHQFSPLGTAPLSAVLTIPVAALHPSPPRDPLRTHHQNNLPPPYRICRWNHRSECGRIRTMLQRRSRRHVRLSSLLQVK